MDSTETSDNQPTNFQNKISKKKMSKKGEHPALPVWENFKKSMPNRFGHYGTTCYYCDQSWSQEKPLILKSHLALHCDKAPDHIITFYLHKVAERGKKLSLANNIEPISEDCRREINQALIKIFICCGPGYTPPHKDTLANHLLDKEHAIVIENTRQPISKEETINLINTHQPISEEETINL
ncbi:1292_t:CDS:2, partial [Dentiscutata heterogama]